MTIDQSYIFKSFDWLMTMRYQPLYHLQQTVAVKLSSGLSCKMKSAISSNISSTCWILYGMIIAKLAPCMERQHCHMSFDVFYVQTSRHYMYVQFFCVYIEAFSFYVWCIHKYITCKLRYTHSTCTSHYMYIMCFL